MTTHTPSTSWGFGEHWIWVAEAVTQRKPGESSSVSNMLATPWPTDSNSLGLSFLSYKIGRCSLWSLNLGPSSWSSSNDQFKQVSHSQSPKCVYQEENHRDNQCNRVPGGYGRKLLWSSYYYYSFYQIPELYFIGKSTSCFTTEMHQAIPTNSEAISGHISNPSEVETSHPRSVIFQQCTWPAQQAQRAWEYFSNAESHR